MASDKSTYNKRYAVINILCRFNQSFALRHKGPFLLLYKYFLRKFCVVCSTDTVRYNLSLYWTSGQKWDTKK